MSAWPRSIVWRRRLIQVVIVCFKYLEGPQNGCLVRLSGIAAPGNEPIDGIVADGCVFELVTL